MPASWLASHRRKGWGDGKEEAQLTEDIQPVIDSHDDHVRARCQTTAVKGCVRAGAASITAAMDPEDNGLRGRRARVEREVGRVDVQV